MSDTVAADWSEPQLARRVTELAATPTSSLPDDAEAVFLELRERLTRGEVRSASPGPAGWTANTWVKEGILLGFRLGDIHDFSVAGFPFFDKHTYPVRPLSPAEGVRIVPGGSTVRTGAYVAPGVVCMPPMFINVGAYVDEGTMVDSHALVGSCAQIGKRVHLSAAAQIGGVLEPVGALPVIIEDEVLVGGNCGVYEGAIVGRRAVLAPGTILTRATRVYDLVHDRVLAAAEGAPLQIPEGAVVVPGSRPARGDFAKEQGLQLYAPVIVKYRDENTDAAVALEDALR